MRFRRQQQEAPATQDDPKSVPVRRQRSRALSGAVPVPSGTALLLNGKKVGVVTEFGEVSQEFTVRSVPGVSLSDFIGEPTRKAKKRSAVGAYDKAAEAIAQFRTAPEKWASAAPAHFVALYAWLHAEVYGAAPAELRSEAWWGAVSAAGKMLRDEFSGDALRMFDFVRWTWRREREREKRRTDETPDSRRVGWRLMFVLRHIVTDYRVAVARAGKKVNR